MKLTANPALGFFHVWVGSSGAKLVRVMKLTTIIILAACLHTTANGIAQNTVTFSGKDVNLESVFTAIKKQTSYRFFFNTSIIQNTSKITIEVKNAPIEQVMNLALKDQSLTFAIKGRTIFVMKKQEEEKKTSLNELPLNPIDVKGRVVNENGEPVESVTVTVKGTQFSTATNSNGEFAMKTIDDNAILVFTSVNMETFEVKVKGKLFVDVTLQAKVTAMQEVVINKGYYTEKKKLATGNVSTVKAKDIQNQPVNNPLLALVGRVPGVTIEQQTGFSNSGITVRIQGRNSINSGLEPLYVIDGVPYLSQPLPTIGSATAILGNSGGLGGGNPLSFINPNDVESIDILKDADATAIYGSRGANGVILITTKKGKSGQTRFNFNLRNGWARVKKNVEMLNLEQYLDMRKEGYINDGQAIPNQSTTPNNSNYDLTVWDQNRYVDWQKELLGKTAKYTDAQFGVSGGSMNTQFLVSSGYHKETTVFPGDFSDRKASFQLNINHSSNNQKFKAQFSSTYVVDNNEIPGRDITLDAVRLSPNSPKLFKEDGTLNWELLPNGVSTWTNPLSYLRNRYGNKVNNLIASSLFSYQPITGLTIRSNFGYTNMQSNETNTNSLESTRPELRNTSSRFANYANGSNNSWIVEPQATYQITIGKGRLESLLGSSFQKNTTNRQQIFASGHSSDLLLKDVRAASSLTIESSINNVYKYNALFGRINYNWQDKYIMNFTARRDGSSRFGSENIFNNFWGISGSWIFSKEKIMANNLSWLNFGKLRVSYGTSGNDQIGDYGFMNLYTPVTSGVGVPYQGIPALAPDKHTNPFLQWEETRKLQFGLDLGFIYDRILINLNYYRNRSSNLLTVNRLSIITGFDRINENFQGVVQNSGWEIAFTSYNIKSRNVNWITNFNLTIPHHNGQLVSFPNLSNTIYSNTYTVGKSLYDIRSYHSLGVDPTTGVYQFSNLNGDPTFTPTVDDQIAFVNTSQQLYGGIVNNVTYKGFEIDFTFQFVKKNAAKFIGDYPGRFNGTGNSGGQPLDVLQRWQKSGETASIQKFSALRPTNLFSARNNWGASDAGFTNASFVRLTNVSLSWQLPNSWRKETHLQGAKIFIQGQNLLTITKYKGLDPLTGSSTTLPPLQIITIGAQLSL